MKSLVTVSWAVTVAVEVDPTKTKNETYLEELRNTAASLAGNSLNWKDGMVTDCEDFPQLAE